MTALGFSLLSVAGCGPSLEEQFDAAREEGYEQGHSEAIDCVRSEGGGAEDAAYRCE